MTAPLSPALNDSDVIHLVIRRLERAADLMVSHRYGAELDEHMTKVSELLEWLTAIIESRATEDA